MDTIVIKIYGPKRFQISDLARSQFLPELSSRHFHQLSKAEKQSTRVYLRRFVFKPPHTNGYLPKIEIFEVLNKDADDVRYILKLTFSVPKLLYGNSVEEASETDFERVLYSLKKTLAGHGITIDSNALSNARVSELHFCKNVLLPREIQMQDILAELQRVDLGKVVDITKKEFKHGGQLLHIYSGTVERVFYEKVADAMRPKVKRKDKGRMARERSIIERYKLTGREIFRFEHRLKKTQTVMRDVNAVMGRPPKTLVALKDIFVPSLCKTMLLNSWHRLLQRPENQLALLGPVDDLALLLHIVAEARKNATAHSMNNALTSYGLATVIRDHGAKEVKRAIATGWNGDHPERLTHKIEAAAQLTRGLPYSDSVAFVNGALERFELLTPTLLEATV